jgi:hypothetical protein
VELADAGDAGAQHLGEAGAGDRKDRASGSRLVAARYMASRQLQKLEGVVGAAAVGGAADRPLERVAVGVDHAGQEQRAAEVVDDRRGVLRAAGLGAHDRAGGVDLDVRRGDPRVVDEAVARGSRRCGGRGH